MKLKNLITELDIINSVGDLDLDITNINSDSRKITNNGLFIAISGFSLDGAKFIPAALSNGATAIVIEDTMNLSEITIPNDITIITVKNTRKALALISCAFYEHPSKSFKLIGITGTKGKTTTTFMIKSILEQKGLKVGLIGGVAIYIGKEKLEDADRTTPESITIQEYFAKMRDAKVDVVVMEVSSQALKLDRVTGCNFDLCLFTNFSEDHISPKEHPDMEDYFNSKLKIFDICSNGYLNNDDEKVATILDINKSANLKTYGINDISDIKALPSSIEYTNTYVSFDLSLNGNTSNIKVYVPGKFSIYNALAAICASSEFDISFDNIQKGFDNLQVPGRSELVPNSMGVAIIIDYAHSPASLENILTAVKGYVKGNLISVFGCGGDRDPLKRPIMGEISGNIADYTIITTDNPRTENPVEIVSQIENGIKKTSGNYEVIIDRKEAIKAAMLKATPDDIVVLAGKGHETYQEINGIKYHYDEREIIQDICKELNK